MQNITPLEQVFSKRKDKNAAGLACQFCDQSRLLLIVLYFPVININA